MSYTVSETTTEEHAPGDRAELWREHVRANHGTLGCAFPDARGFVGSTVVQRAGAHQLVDFWSDAIAYARSERDARADDVVRVVVPRHGVLEVSAGNVVSRVGPGAAVALPRGAGFAVRHAADVRAWILTVPSTTGAASRRVSLLDLRSGPGAVARDLLRATAEQRRTLGAGDFVGLADQAAALLRAGTAEDDVVDAARSHAARQAGDPTLTPARLARDLGWSLRRLQGSLRDAGTSPAEVIRDARLDLAWRTLRAPGPPPSVAEVAFASGFGSLSAFNDAFRRRYGMSPRQARGAAE